MYGRYSIAGLMGRVWLHARVWPNGLAATALLCLCWLLAFVAQPADATAQTATDPVITYHTETGHTETGHTEIEHTGPRPSNAIITDGGWRCRDGYALGVSGRCEAVRPPSNAIAIGNVWRCMTGFVRRGDGCARLVAPAYGYI